MKKLLFATALVLVSVALQAQKNPIDEFFNKYSEKEGFSLVTISGKMFNMFSDKDAGTSEKSVINRLNSIQILSVEDSILNKKMNFYSELARTVDFSKYDELMVVKEGQNITKFLVKQKGEIVSELLVITGGPGGNSVISIRGDLDMKSLSKISREIGIEDIEGMENK